MDVKGKSKVWANEHQKRDGGVWYDYNISISKKKQDGTYTNAYMRAFFTKDANAPEPIPNGSWMEFEGYLSVDEYESKGMLVKKPMIMVTKAVFPDLKADVPDSFSQAEDDIPF